MSVRKIAFVNEGKIKISPENMIYERRKSFVGVYGSLGKRSQLTPEPVLLNQRVVRHFKRHTSAKLTKIVNFKKILTFLIAHYEEIFISKILVRFI